MASLYVGLSGYSYKPWQGEGRFYPVGLKASQFLSFYSERYNAVEMDGSWYKVPSEEAIKGWIEGSPEPFKYSFKMHRRITHMARLKPECYEFVQFKLKRMYPMAVAGKLGPFLVQLPPNLKRDDARLSAFFEAAPKSFDKVQGLEDAAPIPIRWGVEFRHASWNCEEVDAILRQLGVAWVASDRDEEKAVRRDTTDFLHARLRRTDTNDESLDEWTSYFKAAVDQGKDCFVYFKHEDEGSPWIWADYMLAKFAAT